MGMVIRIILLIILLLASGAFAAMYFDVVEPPQFIEKIPVLGKVLSEDQKEAKVKKDKGADENPYLAEIERLKLELENAEAVIADLEEENSELKRQLSATEKERDELKAVEEENNARNEQLKQLAEYYSSMRTKKAAAIMAELDDNTIIGILSNMKDETAAGIMGELEPQRAASLTQKMLNTKGGE